LPDELDRKDDEPLKWVRGSTHRFLETDEDVERIEAADSLSSGSIKPGDRLKILVRSR